jgi:peptidoglycan/LPS O-acetylase OafA/YrhL
MFNLPPIIKEYRPELNGLRALAVLLVLLYHLEFYWIGGGFLGVDIFLVISGYFISKNILYDMQKGKFTFKRFYTKRLRRLFPALIFTLIVVLIAGYFLLTPANYERLGQSTFFSALSLSNFFFWQESGYFDLDAIGKPLLHMWSLSLEEQFYLFWPILLVTFFRFFKKYLFWIVIAFMLGSVVFAESHYDTDPSANFFLIPFRMFEFLLGAACIWLERMRIFKYQILKEFLLTLGIVIMVYMSMRLTNFTRMPGYISLIPCAGAMMAIIGGKARYSSRILNNGIALMIGKASYSIYLIHWPLIVFFRYWKIEEITLIDQLSLGLVSILLGIGMFYFIENTFRYPKKKYIKFDPVWKFVPAFLILICIAGTTITSGKGMADRYTGSLFMSKEEIQKNRDNYFRDYWKEISFLDGDSTKGHILILGNSHSVDLIYALRQNGYEGKVTSLNSTGKCYNFGMTPSEGNDAHCAARLKENLIDENWEKVDAIYLHDNWPWFQKEDFRLILSSVRDLSESPIFVFGPKMIYTNPVPNIVGASRSISPEKINSFAKRFRTKDRFITNNKLIEEFKSIDYSKLNIHYIDVLKFSEEKGDNKYFVVNPADTTFLYFDAGHFTKTGSRIFGAKMKNAYPYFFDIEQLKKKFPKSSR